MNKSEKALMLENAKLKQYFFTCIDWLQKRQKQVNIQDFLLKNGVSTIAIYGMGEFGITLEKEFIDSKITVKYAIDNGKNFSNGMGRTYEHYDTKLSVYRLTRELDEVDAIVICLIEPNTYYLIRDEIEKTICFKCKIFSLEELIYG